MEQKRGEGTQRFWKGGRQAGQGVGALKWEWELEPPYELCSMFECSIYCSDVLFFTVPCFNVLEKHSNMDTNIKKSSEDKRKSVEKL